METLEQNRLIEGIAQATNELILNRDFHLALKKVARLLCQSSGADACFIYQNLRTPDSPETDGCITQVRYFWLANPRHIDYRMVEVLDYRELVELHKTLLSRYCYSAKMSTATGPMLEIMERGPVHSFIMVPIFSDGEHWGNIGFSSTGLEREWTHLEEIVLESLGTSIGAAVERFDINRKLEKAVQARTAELSESNRKFRTLLGNLPGMVYRCNNDQNWTMEFVSGGAKGLTGYRPQDLVGNTQVAYGDLIHPNDQQKVWERVQEGVNNRQPFMFQYRISTADGRWKWVWEQGEGIFDKEGNLQALEGFITDVTQLVRVEQDLQEQARLLSMIYNNTHELMGLIEVSPDGDHRIVSVNQRLHLIERIAGEKVNPNDLVGRPLKDVVYNLLHLGHRYENYGGTIAKAIESKMPVGYQDEVEVEDGRVYHSDITFVPVMDEQDQVTHLLYIEEDITERKLAEMQLLENETRLTALMGNLPGMVYRCLNDENWTSLFVSEGCYDLTGVHPEDFLERMRSINDLILPEYVQPLRKETEEALAANRPFEVTYPIKVADKVKWVWEKGRSIGKMPDGTILIEGFMSDITDRKMAEDKILATIIETEDRERKRIAKEIHDSLGQNLTTASLHFDAIRKEMGELSERGQKKFHQGFDFLTQAISETRTIAHNLMPKAIDDFGYVLAIESLLDNLPGLTRIQFDFFNNLKGERLPSQVEINLYRITQEAINNILKYASPTKVTIQLMKHPGSVILTIEDNGVGFDINKLKDKTATFGINSMRSRASAISGELHIDSSPGNGTYITVEIPLP